MKQKFLLSAMMLCFVGMSSRTFSQCLIPTGLSVSSVTGSSAFVSWDAMAGATSYHIKVLTATGVLFYNSNFNPNTSVTVTGMSPSTHYKVKVRSICPGHTHSLYTQFMHFYTTARLGDVSETQNISLYPNPAASGINVVLPSDFTDVQIMIFDVTGRMIYETQAVNNGAPVQIATDQLSNGLYQMMIVSGASKQSLKFDVAH